MADATALRGATGNRISTMLSQNAIRNRKNMSPGSPAAYVAARVPKLAGGIESRVRAIGKILRIIEENTPQIFEQFEKKSIYLKFEQMLTMPHSQSLRRANALRCR